jgi:hypothetical protein
MLESFLSATQTYDNLGLTPNPPLATDKPSIYGVFDGDEPCNDTAYGYTPNGTEYAICTTVQYGFKPASNATWLTVEPQATQVMTQTKTPEQLQQEAEDSGWLSTWHEFSWWYPWYRLHIKININPVIDVGFNPILPGGETWFWEGLDIFKDMIEEVITDIALEFATLFGMYLVAKWLSFSPTHIFAAIIAESVKFGFQLVLFIKDFDDQMAMIASSAMNFLLGFISLHVDLAVEFIKAVCRYLITSASSAMSWVLNILKGVLKVYGSVRTWLDGVDTAINFFFGGLALIRFAQLGLS